MIECSDRMVGVQASGRSDHRQVIRTGRKGGTALGVVRRLFEFGSYSFSPRLVWVHYAGDSYCAEFLETTQRWTVVLIDDCPGANQ